MVQDHLFWGGWSPFPQLPRVSLRNSIQKNIQNNKNKSPGDLNVLNSSFVMCPVDLLVFFFWALNKQANAVCHKREVWWPEHKQKSLTQESALNHGDSSYLGRADSGVSYYLGLSLNSSSI